jgi:hypothetical protein
MRPSTVRDRVTYHQSLLVAINVALASPLLTAQFSRTSILHSNLLKLSLKCSTRPATPLQRSYREARRQHRIQSWRRRGERQDCSSSHFPYLPALWLTASIVRTQADLVETGARHLVRLNTKIVAKGSPGPTPTPEWINTSLLSLPSPSHLLSFPL